MSPLVQQALDLVTHDPRNQQEILARAGLNANYIQGSLRTKRNPRLDTFTALIGALGYEIVIRKKGVLSPTGVGQAECEKLRAAQQLIDEAIGVRPGHDG